MKRSPLELVAAGLLAGILALTGCGSDDENPAEAPTRSEAQTAQRDVAESIPASLRGSWTREMRARDWKEGQAYPVGTWRFDVDAEGEVGVYYPRTNTVDFSTRFVPAGRELTIESIPICPGMEGRYGWRASGPELRLTVVEDACEPRAALFGGEWRRRAE